jgi:tetratricopeptide (TPR) repeat protein
LGCTAILVAGCAREKEPEFHRFAILRFENLTGDASLDWQGRAFSETLIYELGAISSARLHANDRAFGVRPASAPGISTESQLAIAAGAQRIGYGEYSARNGRIQARLTIENPVTLKVVRVAEASAPAGDVLGAATALARQIAPQVKAFATQNPEALRFFVLGAESPDDAEGMMTRAITADPDFAAPYHSLGQLLVQRRDAAGALAVIGQALARKSFSELERARFELEVAELGSDPRARLAALVKLSRLEPSDPLLWRTLAQTAMTYHDYRQAMEAYEHANALLPDNIDLLNQLGYAAAQAGDLQKGMAALKRYEALRPNDANPPDSMGDINLLSGKLADAEGFYLLAQKKDRAFLSDGDLFRASMARLLTGDSEAANKVAEQYLAARQQAKDPAVDYRRAQWMWISGQRVAALRTLDTFASHAGRTPALRDLESRAWAELAMWELMMGNRTEAEKHAQYAVSRASPSTAVNAVVIRFLTMPPGLATEWVSRAAQIFPSPAQSGIRNFALAYALLVSREFAAAQPYLKQMWDSGAMLDEGLPVMLAWSYLQTGNVKEAAALLRANPIPPATGLTPYTGFYLPRLFYLRAQLAEKEGRREDAREQYRKFLDLSGLEGLAWGEEKKARAAL